MDSEKYIVIELQKNNGTVANIVTTHDTLKDAQYKFHTVAAAAALSEIDKHVVVLINDNGFQIDRVVFDDR